MTQTRQDPGSSLEEPHASAVLLLRRAESILIELNVSQWPLSCIDLNALHYGGDLHTDPSQGTSDEAGTTSGHNIEATLSAVLGHHLEALKAKKKWFIFLHLKWGNVLLKHQLKQCNRESLGLSLHLKTYANYAQITLLALHPAIKLSW